VRTPQLPSTRTQEAQLSQGDRATHYCQLKIDILYCLHQDLWRQKTGVIVWHCSVMLCLAILTEQQNVTDIWKNRQTEDWTKSHSIHCASTEMHSNKMTLKIYHKQNI